MTPRQARAVFVALLALAVGFLAAGGKIYVKAALAQLLLHRAWAATRATGGPVKPWPWADTWPVARLSAPEHGVDLIVLADASGRSLAFGPGHVAGSARPGARGNTVLSGHRDTQFRFLRDLAAGDEIRLETPDGVSHRYTVSEALVVHARQGDALWDPGESRLTLVTCFPFDAVVPGGPLRYVVRAERLSGYAALSPASGPKSPPPPASLVRSSPPSKASPGAPSSKPPPLETKSP